MYMFTWKQNLKRFWSTSSMREDDEASGKASLVNAESRTVIKEDNGKLNLENNRLLYVWFRLNVSIKYL